MRNIRTNRAQFLALLGSMALVSLIAIRLNTSKAPMDVTSSILEPLYVHFDPDCPAIGFASHSGYTLTAATLRSYWGSCQHGGVLRWPSEPSDVIDAISGRNEDVMLVDLRRVTVDGPLLDEIVKCNNIRFINMTGHGPSLLQAICGNLKAAEWLVATDCDLVDADTNTLAALASLRLLDLSCSKVPDQFHLPRLARLQSVYLEQNATDELVAKVLSCSLPQLGSLGLARSRITDDTVRAVSRHKQIVHLDVSGCRNVTDASIPILTRMKHLQRLGLGNTGLTDDGRKTVCDAFGVGVVDIAD